MNAPQPLDRAHWSRAIRGRIPNSTAMLVALVMSNYGNKDGSNCHPGVERLVFDTCTSDKTVRRALTELRESGWLTLVHKGSRKLCQADTYQLSTPDFVPVTGDPYKSHGDRSTDEFLPVTRDVLAVKSTFLPVTGDRPPGPLSPGPINHHSDSLNLPRPTGSADISTSYEDVVKAWKDANDSRIGWDEFVEILGDHVPDMYDVYSMVDSMIVRGEHPRAIINAINAARSDAA